MVTFVGAVGGNQSSTLPAHQADDLIIVHAFLDGAPTAFSAPAGWTVQGQGAGTSCYSMVATKIAASSSETSTGWAGTTIQTLAIYRPATGESLSVGAVALQSGLAATITFPAISLTDPDGSSWVARMVAHRQTSPDLSTAPTGSVTRVDYTRGTTSRSAAYDTDGGVTTAPSQTTSPGGTSSGWRSAAIEIVESGGGGPTRAPRAFAMFID